MRSFSTSVQGPVAMSGRLTLVRVAVIGTTIAGAGRAPLVRGQRRPGAVNGTHSGRLIPKRFAKRTSPAGRGQLLEGVETDCEDDGQSFEREKRMRRRIKGAMKTVVVIALAAGAFAALPPSTWREAEGTMRRHFGSVEMMVISMAERAVDWIDRQIHSLRDRFDAIEDGFAAIAGTRKEEPVRLTRAPGALSGPARVVDGDTLDMGGVRVRLHGIDAPEIAQSCRAGGQRWSCGREATRALAGRIGGNPVA